MKFQTEPGGCWRIPQGLRGPSHGALGREGEPRSLPVTSLEGRGPSRTWPGHSTQGQRGPAPSEELAMEDRVLGGPRASAQGKLPRPLRTTASWGIPGVSSTAPHLGRPHGGPSPASRPTHSPASRGQAPGPRPSSRGEPKALHRTEWRRSARHGEGLLHPTRHDRPHSVQAGDSLGRLKLSYYF